MNHQNLSNLTTQYQQVYLVYCYKVMQYLQALAWLTGQQSTKVKPKSASGVKKLAQKVNQQKPKLKSLKHQEKADVSTNVVMGFPNGAMSAAFRVAFNDSILSRTKKKLASFKQAIEDAQAQNNAVRRTNRSDFGSVSSKSGPQNGSTSLLNAAANATYVYYNEDTGSYEISRPMIATRNGVSWTDPFAGGLGNDPTTNSPPHIRKWFGDDKTIVVLTITQESRSDNDYYSKRFQNYANQLSGGVIVQTEGGHHNNFRTTREDFYFSNKGDN